MPGDVLDLKSWRERCGLSLSAAAEICGFSGSNPAETFRRYELGLVWPKAEAIRSIVLATGGEVTVEAMLATRLAASGQEVALATAGAEPEEKVA